MKQYDRDVVTGIPGLVRAMVGVGVLSLIHTFLKPVLRDLIVVRSETHEADISV